MIPAVAHLTLSQFALMGKQSSRSARGQISQSRSTETPTEDRLAKAPKNQLKPTKNSQGLLHSYQIMPETFKIRFQQQKQATSKKQEQQKTTSAWYTETIWTNVKAAFSQTLPQSYHAVLLCSGNICHTRGRGTHELALAMVTPWMKPGNKPAHLWVHRSLPRQA